MTDWKKELKSFPGIPLLKRDPQYWITNLREIVKLIEEHDTLSPKQLYQLLKEQGNAIKETWTQHLLKTGLKLRVLKRPKKGIYQVNPEYRFMLKEPTQMSADEKQAVLNVLTKIPQCVVVLEQIEYDETTSNAFIMRYLQELKIKNINDVTIRGALGLLRHYDCIEELRVKDEKGRTQILWWKKVDYP